jgi:hypothetical protein
MVLVKFASGCIGWLGSSGNEPPAFSHWGLTSFDPSHSFVGKFGQHQNLFAATVEL